MILIIYNFTYYVIFIKLMSIYCFAVPYWNFSLFEICVQLFSVTQQYLDYEVFIHLHFNILLFKIILSYVVSWLWLKHFIHKLFNQWWIASYSLQRVEVIATQFRSLYAGKSLTGRALPRSSCRKLFVFAATMKITVDIYFECRLNYFQQNRWRFQQV